MQRNGFHCCYCFFDFNAYYFWAICFSYSIKDIIKGLYKKLSNTEKVHRMYCENQVSSCKKAISLALSLAFILLILSGVIYRVAASRLKLVPNPLPISLSAFPSKVGNWVGSELSIATTTKEYMQKNFADDFLSRRYVNSATKAWADVYIVYCTSRPGGILGHRPRVCYPGNGWIHDSTEPTQVMSRTSRKIPCLIHRFHKPSPRHDQIVVLNFYILNGQITVDENEFSGPFSRKLNRGGDQTRYISQIQISSVLENSIREAAKDITGLILDYFPDENSILKAEIRG